MKKYFYLLIILGCIVSLDVFAQCKTKKVYDKPIKDAALKCNATLGIMTKVVVFFNAYDSDLGYRAETWAKVYFAKGGNDYFIHLQLQRATNKKFKILVANPLEFTLSTGETIQVFPCDEGIKQSTAVSSNFLIKCIYKIEKDQLQKLSSEEINMVTLHYSAEKELSGARTKEEGAYSFVYKLDKKDYRERLKGIAGCILTK